MLLFEEPLQILEDVYMREVVNSNRFEILIRLKFSNLSMAINQAKLTKLDPTESQTCLQYWFEISRRTEIVMLGYAHFSDS